MRQGKKHKSFLHTLIKDRKKINEKLMNYEQALNLNSFENS